MRKGKKLLIFILLILSLILPAQTIVNPDASTSEQLSSSEIPAFSGTPYAVLNNNVPNFSKDDLTTDSFERYSPLDRLGRCGAAFANIGQDLMPTKARSSIGQVKPSGWQTVKYDCVDGKYLYNRCHLIGYQLTAENANEKNLITGTRFLNVDGMLPFENMVADYIRETGCHVLYRVTPVYSGNNLVADGVRMEAMSVEDNGEGILFHVYCYNVQPGVVIDYATGKSREDTSAGKTSAESDSGRRTRQSKQSDQSQTTYILNVNSKRFHLPSCSGVNRMKKESRRTYTGTRDDLIRQGYEPCKSCKP